MSEAIIAKQFEKVTIIRQALNTSILLTTSQLYSAPTNAINNTIEVTLVGGKGSDNEITVGESGETITNSITINPGESIPVYIGAEGIDGSNGGTSSFGQYMYASGGNAAGSVEYNKSENNQSISTNGYAIISYLKDEEVASNE